MNRNVMLGIGMVCVFGVTVGILSNVMPGPHKPTDYLVMGAVATLLCLLLLFVVVINSVKRPTRKPDA